MHNTHHQPNLFCFPTTDYIYHCLLYTMYTMYTGILVLTQEGGGGRYKSFVNMVNKGTTLGRQPWCRFNKLQFRCRWSRGIRYKPMLTTAEYHWSIFVQACRWCMHSMSNVWAYWYLIIVLQWTCIDRSTQTRSRFLPPRCESYLLMWLVYIIHNDPDDPGYLNHNTGSIYMI